MDRIFHILTNAAYLAAENLGEYVPSSIAQEGFIHCSYAHQLCRVANSAFSGQKDLVVLEIDRSKAGCVVIDEDLYALNENFPHIYGKLPLAAVRKVHDFAANDDGKFCLPQAILNRA